MICPTKICKQEIPDDSLYCDQCGTKIARCSKCDNPGTSKFCGKCGGPMVFKEPDASSGKPAVSAEPPPQAAGSTTPPQQAASPAAPQQQAAGPVEPPQQAAGPAATQMQPPPAATVVFQTESKKLLFCHPDGWNMEIKNGDILGRTNGNHTDQLGAIPVISGTHAKITHENGAWYITDQKSTNKTYIGGMLAQPGVPVPIKNNDVVQLANVKFIVREA